MFKGSIVALVTPLKNNSLDHQALVNLINWHCESGTSAIVVCGSTGEGALLSSAEREALIETAVKHSQIPIIVGCGAPSTQMVIDQVKQAQSLGASGVLVVAPYYCKTTQEGLHQHFKAVHDASNIPILLYNNPGRTVIEISVYVALRLFELERIVGIKDSTLDSSRAALMRNGVSKSVALLSGDDPFAAGYLAQGGDGLISITANVLPNKMAEFVKAWKDGDINRFQKLNLELMPLHYGLVAEPNPIPVKAAMALLGKCTGEVRLPLVEARQSTVEALKLLIECYSK
ncbi:MAG: 4-hydroxy-tetrahydrodipicolinate synthase [Proteobacteria bacterium]|nr:4-hydroxy-tetrahydrodipicolinate synthase [Pseudomonadota bacterium]